MWDIIALSQGCQKAATLTGAARPDFLKLVIRSNLFHYLNQNSPVLGILPQLHQEHKRLSLVSTPVVGFVPEAIEHSFR